MTYIKINYLRFNLAFDLALDLRVLFDDAGLATLDFILAELPDFLAPNTE